MDQTKYLVRVPYEAIEESACEAGFDGYFATMDDFLISEGINYAVIGGDYCVVFDEEGSRLDELLLRLKAKQAKPEQTNVPAKPIKPVPKQDPDANIASNSIAFLSGNRLVINPEAEGTSTETIASALGAPSGYIVVTRQEYERSKTAATNK